MDELRSALDEHMDLVSHLLENLSSQLRTGMRPAFDNFIGFFHAIDWKEPWLMGLMGFYVILLLVAVFSRKNINFQMFLFLLSLAGVYLAENMNALLAYNWQSFAGQNYFDAHGVFVSVLWSGPLLVIAVIILVNTLFSTCQLMVRWKRAELRHRARLAREKTE